MKTTPDTKLATEAGCPDTTCSASLRIAKVTREHAIFHILVGHCGTTLTPENTDRIRDEIFREMEVGPCAWAFKTDEDPVGFYFPQNAGAVATAPRTTP